LNNSPEFHPDCRNTNKSIFFSYLFNNSLGLCRKYGVVQKVFSRRFTPNYVLKGVVQKVFSRRFAPNYVLKGVVQKVFSRRFTPNYILKGVGQKVFSRRFAPNYLLIDTSFLKFRFAKFQK